MDMADPTTRHEDPDVIMSSVKGIEQTKFIMHGQGRLNKGHQHENDDGENKEDPGRTRKKRMKLCYTRSAVSRFVDLEAEVSDENEEDEDDEYGPDGFIDTAMEGDEDIGRYSNTALLNRQRDEELNESDLQKIAQDISKRYGGRAAARYTSDMNDVPQRLLMPSVHDASLWQVRVKHGRERDIVFSLMRKSIDLEGTAHPLQILTAFQRDSLPGMIYVESRSAQQLVPIDEMASLLQIKKLERTVTPGTWVRIKRGKYKGDLALVMDITEDGGEVGLKFIPRIDLAPREDESTNGRKRKKANTGLATMRPPQHLFNVDEIVKVWGRKQVVKRNQVYVFRKETYKNGFIEKDFKLNALVLDNVNPTLDEITRFTEYQDGVEKENNVDLSVIAEVSRKAAASVLQPGDHIEVLEGEQRGMLGVVQEISQDVVLITAVGININGAKVLLPARSVRKRFKPGDHVKVITGQNADETGLVVAVTDNVVTFLSDITTQEVSVFSKDVREVFIKDGGAFVAKAVLLTSPKGKVVMAASTHPPTVNLLPSAPTGSGRLTNMGRGTRDQSIGITIMIIKGGYKSYAGTVRGMNGATLQVELHAGNRFITIEVDKVRVPVCNDDGKTKYLMLPEFLCHQSTSLQHQNECTWNCTSRDQAQTWGPTTWEQNSLTNTAQTPTWNTSLQTPAWNASSRTPNSQAGDGARSPTWTVNLWTSNPYTRFGEHDSRTAGSWGGATPGRDGGGGDGGASPKLSGGWGANGDARLASPRLPAESSELSMHVPTPVTTTQSTSDLHIEPTPDGPSLHSTQELNPFDFYEPSKTWLSDPAFYGLLPRTRVTVKGTRYCTPQYRGGDFEDKLGTVFSSVKVGEGYSQTYSVRFDDPNLSDVPVSMKAEFLLPVSPKNVGDHVLVLAGQNKGKAFIVREKNRLTCISPKEDPTNIQEMPSTILALLDPPRLV